MKDELGELLTEHLSDAEKARYERTRLLVVVTMLVLTATLVAAGALMMARGS